jgi:hypothetical protein
MSVSPQVSFNMRRPSSNNLLRELKTFFRSIWIFLAPLILSPLLIIGTSAIFLYSFSSLLLGIVVLLLHPPNEQLLGGRGGSPRRYRLPADFRSSAPWRAQRETCFIILH